MRQLLGVILFWATLSSMAASFTMTLPVGYSAIANPFTDGTNAALTIFPNSDGARDGDVLSYSLCNGNYYEAEFFSGSPSGFLDPVAGIEPPPPPVAPGRGIFYYNSSGAPESVTFTGSVPKLVFPAPYSCGCGQYSLLGALHTNSSSYEDYVGTVPVTGSQVLIYIPGSLLTPLNSTNYNIYTYTNGAWSPTSPPLSMGLAAYFYVPCSTTLRFSEDVNGVNVSDGQFRATLMGPRGSNVVISGTSDLRSWTPVVTNPLAGGSLNFTDILATNFPRRFYKAQLQ